MREHNEAVNRLDFIAEPRRDHGRVRAGRGRSRSTQHDGSVLRLRKLAEDYDPTDRIAAMNYIATHEARGEIVTGLLYVDAGAEDLHGHLNTVDAPLNHLGERELCPGSRRWRRSTPRCPERARRRRAATARVRATSPLRLRDNANSARPQPLLHCRSRLAKRLLPTAILRGRLHDTPATCVPDAGRGARRAAALAGLSRAADHADRAVGRRRRHRRHRAHHRHAAREGAQAAGQRRQPHRRLGRRRPQRDRPVAAPTATPSA